MAKTLVSVWEDAKGLSSEVLDASLEVSALIEVSSLFFSVVHIKQAVPLNNKIKSGEIVTINTDKYRQYGITLGTYQVVDAIHLPDKTYLSIIPGETISLAMTFELPLEYIHDFMYVAEHIIKKTTQSTIDILKGTGLDIAEPQQIQTQEIIDYLNRRHLSNVSTVI